MCGVVHAERADPQPLHQRLEGDRVVALAGGGAPGQRPAPGVGEQVNLGAQSAAGPAQTLPINPWRRRRNLFIRPRPRVALGLRGNLRLWVGSQHRRQPLGGDVLRRLVTGAGGMLMRADHARVDPDGPLRTVVSVGTPARSRSRINSQVPSPDQRRCRE